MADLDAAVPKGTIRGLFKRVVADTADVGTDPDLVALQGTVTIVPSVKVVRFPSLTPPKTIVGLELVCPLDSNGALCAPATTTPDLVVMASDLPGALPNTIQYTATFNFTGISPQPNPVVFTVPTGGVVDLASALPGTPEGGVIYVTVTAQSKVDQEEFDSLVTSLPSTYIEKAVSTQQVIGDGPDPSGVTTQDVRLLVTKQHINPDKVIEQHYVGYSFFSGSPQAGVGTLQGGSDESFVFANGATNWGTVLGYEGIGRAGGDNAARTIATVIGLQGSASAEGSPTVSQLISIRASGPGGASSTVTEARSLDILEPGVGTTRRALYGTGAHRFHKGDAANVVEISNAADTLQWASDGSIIKGYASDGSSVRLTLDPGDAPTARIISSMFSGSKHAQFLNSGSEVIAIERAGHIRFSDSLKQTTIGATGSGAALPANPVCYFKVMTQSGTVLAIPAYFAS